MRLTKLVSVGLATAALAASGATADPGHGKGKGKASCKPAPVMLAGTLAGVEMGLALAGIPHRKGGVDAALRYLTGQA